MLNGGNRRLSIRRSDRRDAHAILRSAYGPGSLRLAQ